MTAVEDQREPPSPKVSPRETEVDAQLSACVQEGASSPGPLQPAEAPAGGERIAIGTLVGGRYRIERELGEGGMGVVYLAADEQVPGEKFAIKVLKEALRPEALTELREEVRKTRKLSHPHIVDVHSVNVDGTRLYVLMEYLEGKSLDRLLDEEFGRGMAFSHAWPIIEDVAAALANAHDHNIIHSDIKPANVFVGTAGRTKLLDFGIARVSRGPLLGGRSGPRALTPAYASCELLEGKEADPRDDIYSFACVIYEMLCGDRPFGELTALEAREAGTRFSPIERLSRGQNAALAKSLALDRDARTGSVESLVSALAAHTEPRARPKLAVTAVILAAIAVAGATVLLVEKLRPARPTQAIVSNEDTVLPATIPQNSVAVLPFVNMSGDKEQEYFSDGLTEEMINVLGQVPDLRVPARTSSFYFKGRNDTIASVARMLKVSHVLEGSVRKAGKRLRITAQLIRADSGYHVWSQAYDRDDTDVFAVQDDIARAVVVALKGRLSSGAQETGARGTTSTEAYYQYLLARQLDRSDGLEGFRRAVEAYHRAIALDPSYAAAYAGLAVAEASIADLTGDRSGVERAQRNVDKAMALAPEDAIPYTARSYLRSVWLWDWSGAQTDIEKALSIDARNSDALRQHARLLADLGRLSQAIAAQTKATELDPLSSAAWESLGFYYTAAGDFRSAEAALDRAIDVEPTSVVALSDLGIARLLQGRGQEALDTFRKIELEALRLSGVAMAEHTLGHPRESQQALEELMARHAQEAAYQIAQVLAWGNEPDRALEWLDRAYRVRDAGISEIETAPILKSLHADPRFNALLRKVKLPELPAGK